MSVKVPILLLEDVYFCRDIDFPFLPHDITRLVLTLCWIFAGLSSLPVEKASEFRRTTSMNLRTKAFGVVFYDVYHRLW